jgi:hypothetical protein
MPSAQHFPAALSGLEIPPDSREKPGNSPAGNHWRMIKASLAIRIISVVLRIIFKFNFA